MDKTDINKLAQNLDLLIEDSKNYIKFIASLDNIDKTDIDGFLRAINKDYQEHGATAVNSSIVMLLKELGYRLEPDDVGYIQRKIEDITASDPPVIHGMLINGMYNDKLHPFLVDNEHILLDIIRLYADEQMPVPRPKYVSQFIDINATGLSKLESDGYGKDVLNLMNYEHELTGNRPLLGRAQQLFDTESDEEENWSD